MKNNNSQQLHYLRDEDVADFLGISLKSLYNKINLDHPLPVYICPPTTRVRLWPVKDFHEWLSKFRHESSSKHLNANRIKRCKR